MPGRNRRGELYIWIPNWDGDDDGTPGFQHYKDRDPIWIKNYTRLLVKDEYLRLSGHRRAVLHGVWLAYATSRRRLSADTLTLSSRLLLKVTTPDLKALSDAGFIEVVASKVLARRYQAASKVLALNARPRARVEVELEVLKDQTPVARGKAGANGVSPDEDVAFDLPADMTKAMPS